MHSVFSVEHKNPSEIPNDQGNGVAGAAGLEPVPWVWSTDAGEAVQELLTLC